MKKKFLIVIDESEELEKAIYFAANRAIHTEGELSLLYIVDPALNALSAGSTMYNRDSSPSVWIARFAAK